MTQHNNTWEETKKHLNELDEMEFAAERDNIFREVDGLLSALKAEVKSVINEEISIMEAEEPSNFPKPEAQEAIYSVLGRLKERITNLPILDEKNINNL